MDTLQFVFEENLEKVVERSRADTSAYRTENEENYRKRDQCDIICEICGKLIRFKAKRHMLIHSQDRPYACHLCDKSFRLPVVLQTHLKTHTAAKPFRCKTCGQRFSRKSMLLQHLNIHSGHRPFVCPVCDETFTQNAILFRHLETHSDRKAFHCDLCNTSYRRKSSLETHLRSKKHLTVKEKCH